MKEEKWLEEGTLFKMVDPAFIEVEQMINLVSHPPYFILTISALQCAVFVYTAIVTRGAVSGSEPTSGRPLMWYKLVGDGNKGTASNSDFPICDDLRWWGHHPPTSPSAHSSNHPPVRPPAHPPTRPPTRPSVQPPIRPSNRPPTHLSA